MTVEAAVAIGSGLAAGSLTLMAFGIDSLIELGSGAAWRGVRPTDQAGFLPPA
jgi:hypothetical protein